MRDLFDYFVEQSGLPSLDAWLQVFHGLSHFTNIIEPKANGRVVPFSPDLGVQTPITPTDSREAPCSRSLLLPGILGIKDSAWPVSIQPCFRWLVPLEVRIPEGSAQSQDDAVVVGVSWLFIAGQFSVGKG